MIDCSATGMDEPLLSFMPTTEGLRIIVTDLGNSKLSVSMLLTVPMMLRMSRLVRQRQRGERVECLEVLEQPASLFNTHDTNRRAPKGK